MVTIAAAAGFVAAAPTDAWSMDPEVTGDAVSQFYDVRSPTGENVLLRRRITAMVGVSAYDLAGAASGDPKAPDISLRIRLRYDADYGASNNFTDPTQTNSFVPGFSQGLVDLMYGYVEGRRLIGGWLGFKLGRQYVTDALGWWSFDGGLASVTTPYFVKAEAYGGLEQRGGLFLSTPRFERDGFWAGNRSGLDTTLYPSFQPAAVAPAFGAAIESAGVTWIHGRLTYRRVYNTGQSNVTEFASGLNSPAVYEGWRISSERLGYAMDGSWSGVGGAKGGIVYDFYRSEITHAYASVEAYIGQKVTVGADYDLSVPSFDGDSIFNFFQGYPMNDVGVRGNVDIDRRLSVAGGAHVRIFGVQTEPLQPVGPNSTYMPSTNYSTNTLFPTSGALFDEGGYVNARWRTGETTLGLRGVGDFGDQGDRAGGDVTGEHVFETRYVASGRVGVWQWNDKIRPDRDATDFTYVATFGYRFAPRSQAAVDWEHDINRLAGQRFRLMLSLSFAVTK